MNHDRKPAPPKACPVCQVAMQSTRAGADIVHRCEHCNLTMIVKAPPRATGAVSRQGERETFSLGDARRTYELLGAGFADARLHPTLVRRPPGHVSEIMHNEGEDFVYIIEGCILLEVGGERHILNKGDSMHFQSHLPHRSATLGNETTLELWVRTQPLFS